MESTPDPEQVGVKLRWLVLILELVASLFG
jgi:hypothetical protein